MSSLTGTKIKDTYDGLLKTTDNGGLGATEKLITDGLGNSSGVYLGTSGNVGIGTPSPTSPIDVVSNSNASAIRIRGRAADDIAEVDFYNYANNTLMARIQVDNGYLGFSTSGTERMRIDSSGNVGINCTPSATKFEVSSGNANNIAHFRSTDSVGYISISDNTTSPSLGNYIASQGNDMFFGTADTERMRIKSDGDIKIQQGVLLGFSDFASGTTGVGLTGGGENLLIYTSGAERARITSGGYLKASNDGSYFSPSGTFHENASNTNDSAITVFSHSGASTPYGLLVRFSSAAPNNTTQNFIECYDTSATRFIVYSNGNVVNTNNSYGAISDAKLKENITDASPKLDDLMQVQVRNFNYIGDDKKQLGVVAQELETIFPAMIDESTDFEEREVELRDENGEIVYETEQVLVSEAVEAVIEIVEHEAIAEELDADGNVIVEAQDAWTEEVIVTPAQEAVYETIVTDEPVMTTEKFDLGTTTKSVKYSVFVPMLIKAIQELKAEVDALKGA